ncbi:hypothetical protein THAOC_15797 [Thalassiosira oceanica]|uniref:Aldehyde dehydrogenase domain-containing protein n=1 Tax=Thalassiosira oceanica TaxID=159749 RepID=K0SBM1_THAOC|nr:hypothetical protein THAOC_15797 [Thalassiosira oceanica]|eukprot:EJK63538.1 hypothetical protein THAOC_15797 [Thalassiosira oceanica]
MMPSRVSVLDLAFIASCSSGFSGFSIQTRMAVARRGSAVDRERGRHRSPLLRAAATTTRMGYSSVPSTADSNLEFTPVEAIGTIHREARSFFWTHATVSREFRMTQLEGISRLVEENRDALVETIRQDLGQNSMYSEAFELSHIQPRAMHARENLSEWMETQRKPTPWPVNVNVPVRSELTPQPRGVCLIITPFNLPVQLSLNPMIDAIAAGNVVVLKMSEKCAHTTRLMTDLLTSGEYVDPRAVRVVNGAADEVTELLRHRFDCISYTGSSKVGKIVAAAAAKHLTPVLLELGGKNPAFVTSRCHIPSAARRIAWGKVSGNAGQMCICPDYVLVDESIKDEFVAELASSLDEMYPVSSYADGNHGGDGCDVGKMISVEHARRVVDMVDSTSRVVYGGEHHDVEGRFVAPTVVEVDADAEDATVMREEIFGPILAVVPVRGVDRMIEHLLQGQVGAAADHEMRAQRFLRHKRHDEAVGELQSPVRGSGLFRRLRPVLRKVRVRLLQPLPRDSGLGQLLHVEARPVQLDNVPPVRRCQGQVLPAAREAALRRREGEGRGENRPPAGVLRGVRRAAVDRRRPPGAERQDGPGLDPRGVSMRDRGRTI